MALHHAFLAIAAATPERVALEVEGEAVTYGALRNQAVEVAATLMANRGEGPPLTAVLGQRSRACFAGILGALASGHGYVPMIPSYPATRIAQMIEQSETRELVVDRAGEKVLAEVLALVSTPLTVIRLAPQGDLAPGVHTLIGAGDFAPVDSWKAPEVAPEAIAYLLFTSGSTGKPKGVMVAHRNIERFLKVVTERYSFTRDDRFSHIYETTFDLSLLDLFGPWSIGACLCVPDDRSRMLPAQYVSSSKITVWFSVPSVALLMKNMRLLEPGIFPGLRVALFCGEALPVPVAEAWVSASPNAVVENIYGPTELTLACTAFRIDERMRAQSHNEVVPIGAPFVGMRAKVVDPSLVEVPPGETGELIMAGPQVALGYWRDPERTAAAFVIPPGESEVFYRTGDRVRRPAESGEPLIFLGRLDHQVKIRGHRVELGEVEAAVMNETGVDTAVAIGWPRTAAGGAEGIVVWLEGELPERGPLLRRLRDRLPRYMVPKQIRALPSFPLNPNGKIDRKALAALLDS